ncbi:MAG: glycosyltransferase family 2 protein [Actinobacteria bacterium]|nr:glycosyltransferase family 2 protein [Actinomycetota bacterium]
MKAAVKSYEKKANAGKEPRLTEKTVSLIVPVYNEIDWIEQVIDNLDRVELPDGVSKEVILVDDGSTDGTKEYLEKLDKKGFRVSLMEENSGKGAAIRRGLSTATGDLVMVQDADMEYDTKDIPKVLGPLLSGEADVVYGSRFKGRCENMAFANRLANKILTLAANVLFFSLITDEATAYKAFKGDLIRSIKLKAKRFEFCPEITAKVLKRGIRIHEVPINYRARSTSEGKKIRWTDGFEAIWTLLKYRFTD